MSEYTAFQITSPKILEIVTPENINNTWDHIETGMSLRLYQFIK